MFEGRKAVALEMGEALEAELDTEALIYENEGVAVGRLYVEAYLPVQWHILIRFGMWEEIISKSLPDDVSLRATTYSTALYAKGVAYAAKGEISKAEEHLGLFLKSCTSSDLQGRVLHNNPVMSTDPSVIGILNVAEAVLRGEIEYRKAVLSQGGSLDAAFDHLREAVRLDTKYVEWSC